MRGAVRRAMEDGAFGMASALIYPPNTFATTEELVEESKAMAPYGGVYITHMRSEADRLLEAVDEVIRIAKEGGVPGEIYHLKAAGTRNWSKEARSSPRSTPRARRASTFRRTCIPYTGGGDRVSRRVFRQSTPPRESCTTTSRAQTFAPRSAQEVAHPTSEWENLCELASPERCADHQPAAAARTSRTSASDSPRSRG